MFVEKVDMSEDLYWKCKYIFLLLDKVFERIVNLFIARLQLL